MVSKLGKLFCSVALMITASTVSSISSAFSFSDLAEEIVMYCKHEVYTENVTLKYKSVLQFKSIKIRIKGRWDDWCTDSSQKLVIGDKYAECLFPQGFVTDKRIWNDNEPLPQGPEGKRNTYIYRGKWVADFFKVKFDEDTSWENSIQNPGNPVKHGRYDGKAFKCELM